jgi:hypothetical protein
MFRTIGETPEQLREKLQKMYPNLTEVQLEVMLVGLIGTRVDMFHRIVGPKLTNHYNEDAEPTPDTSKVKQES